MAFYFDHLQSYEGRKRLSQPRARLKGTGTMSTRMSPLESLVARIRGEYSEMPGLVSRSLVLPEA